MKRMGILLALVMLLAAGCAKAAPGAAAASPLPKDGPWSENTAAIDQFTEQLQKAPSTEVKLKDLNGKEWKLSDLSGKIVLLNFWATWCGPCQAEMPEFQKLYDRIGTDGPVVLLCVASAGLENGGADAAKDAVSEFVKGQKFTFPVLFDEDGSVWSNYQQQGIPASYIIDTKGNIRLLNMGAFRNEDELYAALEAVRKADSGQ